MGLDYIWYNRTPLTRKKQTQSDSLLQLKADATYPQSQEKPHPIECLAQIFPENSNGTNARANKRRTQINVPNSVVKKSSRLRRNCKVAAAQTAISLVNLSTVLSSTKSAARRVSSACKTSSPTGIAKENAEFLPTCRELAQNFEGFPNNGVVCFAWRFS